MNKENDFRFHIPLEIKKAKDKEGNEVMILGGVASTLDEDVDGEILDPNGFDLSYFLTNGFVNWGHQQNETPRSIIGEPTKAEIKDNKLYVEAMIYPWSELGKEVYELAKNINKTSGRKLGWSIEGKKTQVSPLNKKHIQKAKVTGLALTPMPKNGATFVDIIKGVTNGLDEEYETTQNGYLLELDKPNGEKVKIDKDYNIETEYTLGSKLGRGVVEVIIKDKKTGKKCYVVSGTETGTLGSYPPMDGFEVVVSNKGAMNPNLNYDIIKDMSVINAAPLIRESLEGAPHMLTIKKGIELGLIKPDIMKAIGDTYHYKDGSYKQVKESGKGMYEKIGGPNGTALPQSKPNEITLSEPTKSLVEYSEEDLGKMEKMLHKQLSENKITEVVFDARLTKIKNALASKKEAAKQFELEWKQKQIKAWNDYAKEYPLAKQTAKKWVESLGGTFEEDSIETAPLKFEGKKWEVKSQDDKSITLANKDGESLIMPISDYKKETKNTLKDSLNIDENIKELEKLNENPKISIYEKSQNLMEIGLLKNKLKNISPIQRRITKNN